MKKFISLSLFFFFFHSFSYAETYYFNDCKLSNVAKGNYVIKLNKKTIEATLIAADGRVQKYSDPIKIIEKDRVITEKIASGKGDQMYFEYILNSS